MKKEEYVYEYVEEEEEEDDKGLKRPEIFMNETTSEEVIIIEEDEEEELTSQGEDNSQFMISGPPKDLRGSFGDTVQEIKDINSLMDLDVPLSKTAQIGKPPAQIKTPEQTSSSKVPAENTRNHAPPSSSFNKRHSSSAMSGPPTLPMK